MYNKIGHYPLIFQQNAIVWRTVQIFKNWSFLDKDGLSQDILKVGHIT